MSVRSGTLVVHSYNPAAERKRRAIVGLLWILSLLGLYGWCKATMTPNFARTQQQLARTQADLLAAQQTIELGKIEVARFQRGEQVAKEANLALQKTLDERLQEITGLRTDLSFFQRFAGGNNAEAIAVQEIHVEPTNNPRAFKYMIAVSQNLKRGKMVAGDLQFSVSGIVNGKAKKLSMATLLGDATADALKYEFKYFQRFDGTLLLPEGFTPTAIRAQMRSTGGENASKEFTWEQALKSVSNQ